MKIRVPSVSLRGGAYPALVAIAACLLILCELDPAGDYPGMPEGPGLTADEMFNVEEGVRLADALPEFVVGRLSLDEVFCDVNEPGPRPVIGYHNPDHPPLGRLWIGVCHNSTRALFPPQLQQSPFATVCARTAPAIVFAVLVFLVGLIATRWYGSLGGFVAALSLVLMPRLFGHAHLAALETFINLAYCAAVLSVAHLWTGDSPPNWKTACLTGGLFGLALLTKIQAILLPIPITLWAVFHWRQRAVWPLAVWSLTGFVVFFVGWPWLWLDPVEHLLEYLGRTTERDSLYVYYLGERPADIDVPWHYSAVMFLVTVPVGLHLLGFLGLFTGERRAWKAPRERLLLACFIFPLIVFAIPGIAVYDGARLFLVVFPLWAVLIGRGVAGAWVLIGRRLSARPATALLVGLLVLQGFGLWSVRPCWLSYYNLLVGGLLGAEQLGLEMNYWGDGLTRELLQKTARSVPAGATIGFFPNSHQFVTGELERQSPILRQRQIHLEPWDGEAITAPRYVLIFRRRADPPNARLFDKPPDHVRLIVAVERQGVMLAALYEFEQ